MLRSIFCICLVSLTFFISSASANFQPRATFGSSLQSLKPASIDDVIDRAHELLGTPYKWGGTSAETGL